MKRNQQPTWTSLVLAVLRARDDFTDARMLTQETGGTHKQMMTACHYLRSVRAIDCVVNPDGRAWWFALDSCEDQRSKHLDQRTPETKPRKRTARPWQRKQGAKS